MACFHKFFLNQIVPEATFLPSWEIETLIIGTFNPQNEFAPANLANYYYGRTRNYFWRAVPKFACEEEINSLNVPLQIKFLKNQKIGLTDLLVSINDAEIGNQIHIDRIKSFKDIQIELFNSFDWNTENIIDILKSNRIKAVFFTKLGQPDARINNQNTFEAQMRIIENYCSQNNISHNRLHTPSGNGLGVGTPKLNNLINRWYINNQEANANFPFINPDCFDINNFLVNF